MLKLFSLILALVSCRILLASITIDTTKKSFVDEYKRTRIFHGVNAVYKIPPYYPLTEGFDSTSTLSDVDALLLRSLGMNIVRLGVMWPGVEPTKGNYNSTYLDQISVIVDHLGKQNIQVILDFHQDLFHRKYCGEGFPDYVYELCKSEEPANTPPFPLPVSNTTYPLDSDGNPQLDSCLTKMFAKYYLTNEVSFAFQCVYDNKQQVWENFAGYWMEIAKRFKSVENVLGYELINEPSSGDVFNLPKNLLPKVTEKNYLQPLYQYLHKNIRTIDDQKIIFFEGLTVDFWQNGFEASPGDSSYNDRQSLAYHVYCPLADPTTGGIIACNAIDDVFFQMRLKDGERLGVNLIMTEFGAAEDKENQLQIVKGVVDLADKFQQSWMYWQYKYYQDITTVTPQGETLFNDEGKISDMKANLLSRTYPQITAGDLISFNYDIDTKRFNMKMTALNSERFNSFENVAAHTSEIFVNLDRNYQHGVSIEFSSSSASEKFSVTCPSKEQNSPNYNILTLLQTQAIDDSSDTTLVVDITPCSTLPGKKCACKL